MFGNNLLLHLIIVTAVGLTAFYVALILFMGPGPVLAELPWYAPLIRSFTALSGLSIAFLSFGRYQVLREPAPFWIGMAFISYAVLTPFVILAFPGLLADGRSFIALLPNTSTWLAILQLSLLAVFLVPTVAVPWPRLGMPLERWWFWLVIGTVIVIAAIATLSVIFEQFLPLFVVDRVFTPLRDWWFSFVALVLIVTALLSAYRYRQTGDLLLGYVTLAVVMFASNLLVGLNVEQRYSLLWYWNQLLTPGGFMVIQFGLLAEYVGLYRRERDKTRELLDKTRELENLRLEAQRRAAELQGILDNMVDSVFVCDKEGRIVLVNKAGVRLLGMSSPEDAQRDLTELLERVRLRNSDGTPVEPEKMVLVRALAGESIVQADEIVYNSQQRRDTYVRSSAAPIRDEKGKIVGAVAVTKDITELTELDRLKDEFLTIAAHELKTPVTGVKGFAQFLLRHRHEGVSPVELEALEAINRQSDRISRLVNELLEISRIQTGRLELRLAKIDLSQLAAEAVERMKLATEKHRLLFQSPGPVFVNADADRIEQVIETLLDNAIKFSPQGGDIETLVRVVDGQAVVSIRDYGVGIPKEKQARVFERFYRAHTGTPYDYGGMGVGLFISRETIIRQGGMMWFESEEGKGSTFCFSLPLV